MHFPVETLQAKVFTSLPDEFREPRPNAWSNANQNGVPCHSFLEGPTVDADGNLLVVDIPYGRIFKISPEGQWALHFEYDGWPNGLAMHRDGRIFIADYRRGLLSLHTDRTLHVEADHFRSEGFKGLNDLTFSSQGDLFFTDQGQTGLHDASGRVFRWRANEGLHLVADFIPSPNGLLLDEERQLLFVAVTRANAVWRLPMVSNAVSKVGLWLQLSGGVGPDGMAADAEGGVVVAHPGLGVWRFDRHGRPTHFIDLAGKLPTNVAFGGNEQKQLFITDSLDGTILVCDLPVAGKPLFGQL